MDSSDEQWWDVQCGEYVLGTLQGADRAIFEKIIRSDEDVRKRVESWQRLFKALDDYVPSTKPPPHVLSNILQAISTKDAATVTAGPVSGDELHDLTSEWARDLDETLDAPVSVTIPQTEKVPGQHAGKQKNPARNTTWRAIALISMAACVILAALLIARIDNRNIQQPFPGADNLSILLDSRQQALWLLTASSDSDEIHILAVEPPSVEPGHHHHLWIVLSDGEGVIPVSILPEESGDKVSVALPVPVSQAAGFSVSVEPGGAPVGLAPAGPVVFSGTIQRIRSTNTAT